jgi:hypothetical protein
MNNEQGTMKNGIATCLDCLHCKVSAKSMENPRLCFCIKTKTKLRHKESYWLEKKVCPKFYDMGD